MRIVFISDTHGHHDKIDVPDGDILIHAGDISMEGVIPEITKFNIWLGTLPHKNKIIIAGNHDFCFEKDKRAASKELSNCHYLQDNFVICEGLKIYGSPWTPWYYDWAFNLERGAPLKKIWKMIPDKTDILVTHGPPYGILDDVTKDNPVGCKDLLNRVLKIKPKIHAFGHIHPAYGEIETEGIKFINCSSCDVDYHPVNLPIVTDL